MSGKQTRNELRAAFTNRELRKARFNFPHGNIGVFMQVTLAIVYMYLILISYLWMGVAGSLLMSGFFLVVLFLPLLYRIGTDTRSKRKTADNNFNPPVETETEQEG
ncbi:MAG: hypothetical protein GY703_23880 [Gammaproteobacteria bacterium]|nr:hypothetical protein [Gammaproteobacteria bacterium]